MYDFIEGAVAGTAAGYAVIEAGGVGYRIYTDAFTLRDIGERARLYTALIVREDEMTLYGFDTVEKRGMFERLIAISGVGPKAALSIMSALPVYDLTLAIITGDEKAFKAVSGVGPKTAQRIILELSGKLETPTSGALAAGGATDEAAEAIAGLMALGYTKAEASSAIARIKDKNRAADELIVEALRREG